MKKILFSLLLGCITMFAACDKDNDDNDKKIDPGAKSLTGTTWVYNGASVSIEFSNTETNALFASYLTMINSQLSQPDPTQTIVFSDNGTFTSTDAEGTYTGSYVKSGNTLTITDEAGTYSATYSISGDILTLVQENQDPEMKEEIESSLPLLGAPEGTTVKKIQMTVKFKAK